METYCYIIYSIQQYFKDEWQKYVTENVYIQVSLSIVHWIVRFVLQSAVSYAHSCLPPYRTVFPAVAFLFTYVSKDVLKKLHSLQALSVVATNTNCMDIWKIQKNISLLWTFYGNLSFLSLGGKKRFKSCNWIHAHAPLRSPIEVPGTSDGRLLQVICKLRIPQAASSF